MPLKFSLRQGATLRLRYASAICHYATAPAFAMLLILLLLPAPFSRRQPQLPDAAAFSLRHAMRHAAERLRYGCRCLFDIAPCQLCCCYNTLLPLRDVATVIHCSFTTVRRTQLPRHRHMFRYDAFVCLFSLPPLLIFRFLRPIFRCHLF